LFRGAGLPFGFRRDPLALARPSAYLRRMALIRPSTFFRQVNPRGAISDFREVWRQAGSNRWRFAVVSAICTIAVFSVMFQEGAVGPPRRPTIEYITVWDPHRSDAEIMATNLANQKRKERLAAEQAARDEEVREMYKTIGRASGMDVDAIEAKAKADQAAEDRAKAEADKTIPKAPAKSPSPQSPPPQSPPAQSPPKAPIVGE